MCDTFLQYFGNFFMDIAYFCIHYLLRLLGTLSIEYYSYPIINQFVGSSHCDDSENSNDSVTHFLEVVKKQICYSSFLYNYVS